MTWTHAESYKGLNFHKVIHRSRLKKLTNIFNKLNLNIEGIWGDFGCSDGFYFDYLREKLNILAHWKLYGFDHNDDLLDLANKRNISNSIFVKFDLQAVPNITSINPKKSKYQQKTHFAFNSSSKY